MTGVMQRFKGQIVAKLALMKHLIVTEKAISLPQVVAAAGSNSQANATPMTAPIAIITTVSASSRGVVLQAGSGEDALGGTVCLVINATATNVKVFPPSGDQIQGGGLNTAVTLLANKAALYVSKDGTDWEVLKGA